jgi:formate C-acetyltransferase
MIFPEELIVGCLGCDKKGAPVHPEFGLNWVVNEMRDGLMNYSEQRTHDYFSYTPEVQQRLEALRDFWDGHTVEDYTNGIVTEEEIKGSHDGKGIFFADAYVFCGAGHLGLDYDRLFSMGFAHVREIARATRPYPAQPDIETASSTIRPLTCQAAPAISRYAALADECGRTRKGSGRELHRSRKTVAGTENPPATFWSQQL